MPAFSCSSRHFTHFAIYWIIFGVGNFSRGFFVCSERKMFDFRECWGRHGGGGGGQAPVCFHYGLSRLSEVTIFVTDACMLNPVREGEEDWSDSLPSPLENFLFINIFAPIAAEFVLNDKDRFLTISVHFQIKLLENQVDEAVYFFVSDTVNSLVSDHTWFAAKWSLTGGGRLWEKWHASILLPISKIFGQTTFI